MDTWADSKVFLAINKAAVNIVVQIFVDVISLE